jgi:hypothetical protein
MVAFDLFKARFPSVTNTVVRRYVVAQHQSGGAAARTAQVSRAGLGLITAAAMPEEMSAAETAAAPVPLAGERPLQVVTPRRPDPSSVQCRTLGDIG